MRWQRLLLPAIALFSLFFVAAAEYGRLDIAGANKRGFVAAIKGTIVAALKDPLSLLAKRSPGSRNPGALHLTKSGAGPHERVLSEVRERSPVPDLTPEVDNPTFTDNAAGIASSPGTPPVDFADNQVGGSPIQTAFNSPLGFPGILTGPAGFPGGAGTPPGESSSPNTPGNPGTSDIPAGGPSSPINTQSGNPGAPGQPPGVPNGPPGNVPPPATAIPEPATWVLMIFGLLAVLVAMRRIKSRRTA